MTTQQIYSTLITQSAIFAIFSNIISKILKTKLKSLVFFMLGREKNTPLRFGCMGLLKRATFQTLLDSVKKALSYSI